MMIKNYSYYGIPLLLLSNVYNLYCYNVGTFPVTMGWNTTHESRVEVNFYSGSLSYVNGGITFTYPASFFSMVPSILITIELAGLAYSAGQLVMAEVSVNSTTSATVRVNVFDGLTVSEAASGDVIIHFRAVGL